MIEIDVKERKLNIIGVNGVHKTPEEIDEILKERRKNWKPRTPKYNKGVMGLFYSSCSKPNERCLSGIKNNKY